MDLDWPKFLKTENGEGFDAELAEGCTNIVCILIKAFHISM